MPDKLSAVRSRSFSVDLPVWTFALWTLAVGGLPAVAAAEDPVLEALADIKTTTDGFGEDFSAAGGYILDGPVTEDEFTGDSVVFGIGGEGVAAITLALPQPLPLTDFPYLAVRVKAQPNTLYFIRPNGIDGSGAPVALWWEDAVTDDRTGTGDWETLTFSLPKLVAQAGTGGTATTAVSLVAVSLDGNSGSLEVDWLRIHNGLTPAGDLPGHETNFTNHLDDDGDGLTDRDDPDRAITGRMDLLGTDRPRTLAYYHSWYGNFNGPSQSWQAWAGSGGNGEYHNPANFVPGSPGKRDITAKYYPLNTRDYPNYEPPSGGQYQYDMYGGLELYDNLSPEFLDGQIRLAQKYGIEGFMADVGHQSYLRYSTEALLRAVERAPQPFSLSALYDFYYDIPGTGIGEIPNYAKAREIDYFLELAKSPRYTRFYGRPLINGTFASFQIPTANWIETVALATDPRAAELDGTIDAGSVQKGAENQVRFRFSESPEQGNRNVRFERIVFRDANLVEISRLDFGTPQVRALLGSSWAEDMLVPLRPGVWAMGQEATMHMTIPENAEYMDILVQAQVARNVVSMSINGGAEVSFNANFLGNLGYFRFSPPSVPEASIDARPFTLLLDSEKTAPFFDGFAAFGENLSAPAGVLVSDDQPVILSVQPGYDDRKIRSPGAYTSREDGMRYRRQWETVLAQDPDVVMLTTWNEWLESTFIEPSVEFGYKYLELTLTYSLQLRKQLELSRPASEFDFTMKEYGDSKIRFTAGEGQAMVTFGDLRPQQLASYSVTLNGGSFGSAQADVNAGTLALALSGTAGEYVITFDQISQGPQIDVVANAASNREGDIAPGEFISIYGANLGPADYVSGFEQGLGGTRVFINGIEAYLTLAWGTQLNVLVPLGLPSSGTVELTVEYNGKTSLAYTLGMAPAAPGIFTQNYGPGQAWIGNQDYSFNGPDNPAARGSYVSFFVSGGGLTDPAMVDGQHPPEGVFPTPQLEVTATVGGMPANVVFKGMIYAGVLQVNIQIPENAPVGSAVALRIKIGGVETRADVTMAVE